MYIGGFEKFSLSDYPGKICSVIFTVGCNFRCAYCYNLPLILKEYFPPPIPFSEIESYLKKRKGFIDAVVFSGGEPTIQPDLIEYMKKIKEMNFLIKLDTNGALPEVIVKCIEKKAIDYIAMDIKAPLERYEEVVGVKVDIKKILESIRIIKKFPNYEFRTTLYPALSKEDFEKIFKLIEGAKRYYLQVCRLENTLKDCSHLHPLSRSEIAFLKEKAKKFVKFCEVRE